MKQLVVGVFVVILCALMVGSVAAQDTEPPEAPVLDEPTDLMTVLGWLAAGGAGPSIAFYLAKLEWFEALQKRLKLGIVFSAIVGVPLIAKVLVDLVPATIWATIQPYWATAIGALLIGWPLSQVTYEKWLREPTK